MVYPIQLKRNYEQFVFFKRRWIENSGIVYIPLNLNPDCERKTTGWSGRASSQACELVILPVRIILFNELSAGK